ncbi:MAG: response regulator transcription factor [Proteobacteria bacterium]|nr:response regulator transcription factor [Pseudomonadota bacterium]
MPTPLKLLLVEDSKLLVERLSEVISQIADIDLVGTVDNENDAVARLKGESVDVVILDLRLRQGTGFGVLRALAGEKTRPRIVVLTTYDLPEYKSAALALGAGYFLDKARDCDRIPDVLNEIAEGLQPAG